MKFIFLLLVIVSVAACSAARNSQLDDDPPAAFANEVTTASNQVVPKSETPVAAVVEIESNQPATPTAEATVTALPTVFPTPEFTNPVQEGFQTLAAQWDVELSVIDMSNTGLWQFADETLVHPVALQIVDDFAYVIDSGRLVRIDLENAGPPEILLAPEDLVEGVRVLEPLDLAITGDRLAVLDRAGDVYAYDIAAGSWKLDRYDRPVEASSGHYSIALAGVHSSDQSDSQIGLLETNYKYVQLYDNEENRIWRLPEQRAIDLDFSHADVFVLQRELHDQRGFLTKYRDASGIASFAPRFPFVQPRQVVAGPEGIYVLDQGGGRLLLIENNLGQLLRIIQLPQEPLVTAFAVNTDSGKLVLIGRDRLYFVGDPDKRKTISNDSAPTGRQIHDPQFLTTLDDFIVPIGGSNITFRDFQLPGAPRHYRLGIHNGLDFYWQPGTKVRAAGDGVVIRADTDYIGPTAQDLMLWKEDTLLHGYTTPKILDSYMGRQVWLEHGPGIITRYAHLRSIEPGLVAGSVVSGGQTIGEVGNSGSPASLESEASDAHLHFELWVDDSYLGQFMRPIETRDWIEKLFPVSR